MTPWRHALTWMAFPRQVLVANRDDRRAAFAAADAVPATRNPQNEYSEWWVKRNAAGKITKVVFTAETLEYWQKLWDFSPTIVRNLYRSLLGNPTITEASLRVGGAGSAYNKLTPSTPRGHRSLHPNINTLALRSGARGSVLLGAQRDNYEMSPVPAPRSTRES